MTQKPKRKNNPSRQIKLIFVGGIVIVVALVLMLTVLGPSVGRVYSNVVQVLPEATALVTSMP
ncbi:hypothetical protein G4Y79_12085 [Phototrophicus methaneseepsis]|uniref:Uncharacterized protein n=1 Tax=Phototrophicus methaneseepsis TaxID=2710758 RepID=A0A7S8EDN5_9CHLR|nr:hypothetical protein [Phototrophicus methaneseepsis]QPC85068.1 hypothetical protein G4Y79_12085 [Phototrophicus methaneseepsis]